MKKKILYFVVAVVMLVPAYAAYKVNNNDLFFLIKKNFTLFSEAYQEISVRYVDEVNPEVLMRRGLSSMLQSLDPYTVIFDEAQSQQMNILTTGKYAGVGIDVGSRGGRLVVLSATEGYSAHNKGVRAGDVIVAVNGFEVAELAPEELEMQLLGEAGSKISLTIERYGIEGRLTFDLERERIEVKNIAYSGFLPETDAIAYILISRFGQNTAAELREAIGVLQEEQPLKGLILDLRNNPGGLLDEAVKTVNKFVGPGIEVVSTRGRTPDTHFSYATDEPALLPDLPLVILQDHGSASASEIVAGAVQDLDRGIVIGQRSFGKGLVQIIRPLSYDMNMKITVSKYYIPSGRSIQSVQYLHEGPASEMALSVPDSLRRPYKTKGGRTVYDGAGVEPDILIEMPRPSMVEVALLQNSRYFFYAAQHGKPDATSNASELPDAVYNDFVSWLKKDGFDFSTQSEVMIADLESNLTQNGIQANSPLGELRKLIDARKDQELLTHKTSIKKELHLELASQSGGPVQRLKARLGYDDAVKRGIHLLQNPADYHAVLSTRN